MKKMIVVITALIAMCLPAKAQTSVDFQNLLTWVSQQQVNVGTGINLRGIKYASSWWDLISVGQAGLNVGKAGSLDYVDLGPVMAIANSETPRYGVALPIHIGNLWSRIQPPPSIASHIVLAALPNITIAPAFLWPHNGQLNKWTWKEDFQPTIAYRFGGS